MMHLQTTQAETSGDLIDLALGHPSPFLLPLPALRRAAQGLFRQKDPSCLQYGYEPGDGRFRVSLASFLTRMYGSPVDPDQLFISNGASQALDLICTLYTRPGDLVFVEEPSYFLALRIFTDHHLKVQGLPTDDHGLVLEALEERLKRNRPVFLYTVCTHQNPSGVCLSEERRRRLAALSREHGFLVLADEVYHLLSYGSPPPPPLASFLDQGRILSLGSFSKILAPGLRLGWVQGTEELLRPLASSGLLDSGGGLAPFTSALVREAIDLGLQEEHVQRLRVVYGERLGALSTALREIREGASGLTFKEPAGGFFLWLKLPEGMDSQALLTFARERKVSFVPGGRFSSTQGLSDRLRLSFSYYEADALYRGVERLILALQDSGR